MGPKCPNLPSKPPTEEWTTPRHSTAQEIHALATRPMPSSNQPGYVPPRTSFLKRSMSSPDSLSFFETDR